MASDVCVCVVWLPFPLRPFSLSLLLFIPAQLTLFVDCFSDDAFHNSSVQVSGQPNVQIGCWMAIYRNTLKCIMIGLIIALIVTCCCATMMMMMIIIIHYSPCGYLFFSHSIFFNVITITMFTSYQHLLELLFNLIPT